MMRIIVVDDEKLIATSLSTMLSLEEDIDVVATFSSGRQVLDWWHKAATTGELLPDVCITDLQLGYSEDDIDGVEVAGRIGAMTPGTPTLIVTSHARPQLLRRALDSGVQGFMPKTSTAEAFAQAVRLICQGKRYVDPELAAMTISAQSSPLTAREAEVIEAAGRGGSIEEIGQEVHLASGTTRNYLSSAMSKLDAQNRFEAYLKAREKGWI